jgi:uncharacterized protein
MIGSEDESAFNLTTPSGTIFGTLLLPPRPLPVPVALIIADSGATDRNGNGPTLQLNMYAKLAYELADCGGIASVRYDKRGISASHVPGSSESDMRFETYADDAAAWVAKLRSDERFSRVAIVGHGEGSLVGMLAAQRAPVDAYVSLDGAGFPVATTLCAQLQAQLESYPDLAAKVELILATLANGKTVAEANVPAELMELFRPSVQPYLISWLKYDPCAEIAKVTAPVTIIAGTNDRQVPIEDGRALAAAVPSAAFETIDGMTHVLTNDPGSTDEEQLTGAYVDAERPLDTSLIRALTTAVTAG